MSETEIVVGETVKKRKRPKMPPKETVLPLHGTRARYVWKDDPCRCKLCRAANREWQQQYRKAKKSGAARPRSKAVHGTRSKYVAGCRCEPCTQANRDYQREVTKASKAYANSG